jgi:hypothetical protein
MTKSEQTYCIYGKQIMKGNDRHDSIFEIIGKMNKDTQLFHSIDCALIYKRLESVYGKSNVF